MMNKKVSTKLQSNIQQLKQKTKGEMRKKFYSIFIEVKKSVAICNLMTVIGWKRNKKNYKIIVMVTIMIIIIIIGYFYYYCYHMAWDILFPANKLNKIFCICNWHTHSDTQYKKKSLSVCLPLYKYSDFSKNLTCYLSWQELLPFWNTNIHSMHIY